MRKAASLAALLAFACAAAQAQTLYRWVDADGKVNYGDRVPAGFKGHVTRIEADIEKTTMPPAPAAPAATTAPAAKAEPAPARDDPGAKRRATRGILEGRLAQARAGVDSAKKALDDAQVPGDDEKQVIQQRAKGGMHGMAPRSNCRQETVQGKKVLMCPTMIPTPEYHDRLAALEAALKKAEDELSDAERAWRRGVD